MEECILDYMALYIECRINKNSLLQCYFLAILPAGTFIMKIFWGKKFCGSQGGSNYLGEKFNVNEKVQKHYPFAVRKVMKTLWEEIFVDEILLE